MGGYGPYLTCGNLTAPALAHVSSANLKDPNDLSNRQQKLMAPPPAPLVVKGGNLSNTPASRGSVSPYEFPSGVDGRRREEEKEEVIPSAEDIIKGVCVCLHADGGVCADVLLRARSFFFSFSVLFSFICCRYYFLNFELNCRCVEECSNQVQLVSCMKLW